MLAFLQTGSCWLEVAGSFRFAEDGHSLFCDASCATSLKYLYAEE